MPIHRVKQGESAVTIAHRYGVRVDDLWASEANQALVERRQSPHVLLPGDEIDVPEKPTSKLVVTAGGISSFQANIPRVPLRVRFVIHGAPCANRKYTLLASGGTEHGTLDADGYLNTEISALESRVEVLVEDPDAEALYRQLHQGAEPSEEELMRARRRFLLALHHLDPIHTPTGIAQRLANLGWALPKERHHGDEAEKDARLSLALRAFQAAHGLPPTGDADDPTLQKLVDAHGI